MECWRGATSADTMTMTVLQDAQVIATGQKMEPDPQGKPATADVVTLLVNPEDAKQAVEASAQGSVYCSDSSCWVKGKSNP